MEAHHELVEATWLSQLSLALLTIILVHLGQPGPQEDVPEVIRLELDGAEAERAEALVEGLVEATGGTRVESLSFEHARRRIEERLGVAITAKDGWVCVRDDSGAPGCCVRLRVAA
jgi:hypothetical protein